MSAFKQAKFATIACPAWMTGVIEGNAGPDAKGKWDIAQVPGSGGNWGGSTWRCRSRASTRPRRSSWPSS